jgi:hypothetical protein
MIEILKLKKMEISYLDVTNILFSDGYNYLMVGTETPENNKEIMYTDFWEGEFLTTLMVIML